MGQPARSLVFRGEAELWLGGNLLPCDLARTVAWWYLQSLRRRAWLPRTAETLTYDLISSAPVLLCAYARPDVFRIACRDATRSHAIFVMERQKALMATTWDGRAVERCSIDFPRFERHGGRLRVYMWLHVGYCKRLVAFVWPVFLERAWMSPAW